MKEILQLTKFFTFSFYNKPKNQMVQIVLIIALIYGFFQITALNFLVYFLSTTEMLMFYNLAISAIFVFALTCYLSTTQVFAFNEFQLLASLPLLFKKTSIAKVISGIIVPVGLSLIIQIPTLLFLLIDTKFTKAIKFIIFLPVFTGGVSLILLFILSFVNRFYYQFKNKVAYLLTNISIMVIMPLVLFVYFIKKSVFLAEISFQSLQDILSISGYILRHMQDAVGTIPVINMIVDSVVADGITLHFAFSYIVIVIAGTILAYITIQNISTNYFRNGILENEQTNNRSSKVHISKNKWSNYIQREFWVLNSEAYFKLQFIMGMILAPIVSLIYFLLIQSEWLPAYVNMTDNENFTMYYFYFILFLSTMNNISGTPYSREGKYHYLLNSTPLNSRFIYFTKVFVASSMSMISILLSFLFLIGFGYWEADAIVMLLIISGLAFIYNLLTPIYDRKNPVIVWETPSTAIKSNPNVLVSLLYGMPILVVICILHFALMWIHIPPYINYIIVLFGIIITIFLLIKRIIKKEKMGVK